MKNIILVLFLALSCSLCAQEKTHFLVEFEKFSPPVKELIASYENFPAPPFLAPDLHGNEHYSANYKGKKLLIWFWSAKDGLCLRQLSELNKIKEKVISPFQIISFGQESKAELLEFEKNTALHFPVIFQSKIFGDAAYAGDLGLGRIIIVDEFGVIQKVLPRSAFEGSNQGMNFLKQYFSIDLE